MAELAVGDDFAGLHLVVRAEYEDALAVKQEGIHIGDVDAGVAEDFHYIGGSAGMVVKLEGEHVRESHCYACILEAVAGAARFGADDAEDAVLGGICNRAGDHLDVGTLHLLKHHRESSGAVLYENGKLRNSHSTEILFQFAVVDDVCALALAALESAGGLEQDFRADAQHAAQFGLEFLAEFFDGSGSVERSCEVLLAQFHLHLEGVEILHAVNHEQVVRCELFHRQHDALDL